MAGRDLAVDAVPIVRSIAGERSDGIVNLVQQGSDLRAVTEIIGGQRRRDDSARVGIASQRIILGVPTDALAGEDRFCEQLDPQYLRRQHLAEELLRGTGRAAQICSDTVTDVAGV